MDSLQSSREEAHSLALNFQASDLRHPPSYLRYPIVHPLPIENLAPQFFDLRLDPTAPSHLPAPNNPNVFWAYGGQASSQQIPQEAFTAMTLGRARRVDRGVNLAPGIWAWGGRFNNSPNYFLGLYSPGRSRFHMGWYRRLSQPWDKVLMRLDLRVLAATAKCYLSLIVDSETSGGTVMRHQIRLGHIDRASPSSQIPTAPDSYYQAFCGPNDYQALDFREDMPYAWDFEWNDTAPILGAGLCCYVYSTPTPNRAFGCWSAIEFWRR